MVPITTLMHRLLPTEYLAAHSLLLKVGQLFDIQAMRRQLEANGYRCTDTVYEHGEFALRGSIMDIFPMGSSAPYRIDLLDDEIDTLRTFDAETQRTINQIDSISLLPGKEFPLDEKGIANFRRQWHEQFDVDHRQCTIYQDVSQGIAPAGIEYYLPLFFDQCGTLFDYLPDNSLVFHHSGLENAADQFWSNIHQRFEDRNIDVQRPLLAPQHGFFASNELFSTLKCDHRIV